MTQDTPTPTRGVPLTINGTDYRLRFSFARLRQIREALGSDALTGAVPQDKLMQVIWYGLGGEQSPLSLAELEDAVDLQNLPTVVAAMQEAMAVKTELIADPQTPTPAADTPGPTA